jgi:hypothetical protein
MDVERQLEAIGGLLDYPTSEVRSDVRVAIAQRRLARRRRYHVALAAGMVVVAIAPVFVLPASRNGLLDLLGLRDSGETLVAPPAQQATSTVPLTLGARSTLAAAKRAAQFRLLLPRGTSPNRVYLGQSLAGGTVTFVFLVGDRRIRLTEFRGHSPLASGAQKTAVNGRPALWLARRDSFTYIDPSGSRREVHTLDNTNALVWEKDGVTLRIDAIRLTQPEALSFARGVT